jgi:aspartate oxidase
VFSHRAARAVRSELDAPYLDATPVEVGEPGLGPTPEWREVQDELRSLMWDDCGIVRSDERLAEAERRVSRCGAGPRALAPGAGGSGPGGDPEPLRRGPPGGPSARSRKESRGLHFNVDYPQRDERFRRDTVLRKEGMAG